MTNVARSMLARLVRGAPGPAPAEPFCTEPLADRATYLKLHAAACSISYPEIDAFEAARGFAIDRDWMNELALHTQVVIKKSRLNFQHGRLLYSVLRRYLADRRPAQAMIVETGTARGYSSLCMARALADAGVPGRILTIDMLPHETAMYWNCIDDNDGRKSRRELLRPWADLCETIIWLQSDTREAMARTGLPSVDFAFLDAAHTLDDIMIELSAISRRQTTGNIVVFDDVTPALFPGVVEAVEAVAAAGHYRVERLNLDEQRGYAIATRI